MNDLAKRLYNLSPDPVRLTFADGSSVQLSLQSAEFFGEQFQGEGEADGTTYRLVSDGTDDPLVAGRDIKSGWEPVGTVTAVERPD